MEIKKLLVSDITQSYLDSLNNPTYMQFSRNKRFAHTQESQREYIRSFENAVTDPKPLLLGIFEGDQLSGTLSVYFDAETSRANIGILIFRTASSRGLGKRALAHLSRWVKARYPTYSIELGAEKLNTAMTRVALSSGYTVIESGRQKFNQFRYESDEVTIPKRLLDFFISPGLFFGTDTGGVEQLIEIYLKLESLGLLVIQGGGSQVADYYKIRYLAEIREQMSNFKSLVYATGFDPAMNMQFENHFLALRAPRISILDHWTNYRNRFNSNIKYLPNLFLTSNDLAYVIAKKTFPKSEILQIPDFRLERVRTLIGVDCRRRDNFVLVLLEPERPASEGLGAITKHEQLKAIEFGIFLSQSMNVNKVLLRLHPKMDFNSPLVLMLRNDPSVELSNSQRVEDDLVSCRAVVGLSTSVLYLAAKIGLPTFTVLDFGLESWISKVKDVISYKKF